MVIRNVKNSDIPRKILKLDKTSKASLTVRGRGSSCLESRVFRDITRIYASPQRGFEVKVIATEEPVD